MLGGDGHNKLIEWGTRPIGQNLTTGIMNTIKDVKAQYIDFSGTFKDGTAISYGQQTYVDKQGNDYCLGNLKGSKKEILEVADCVNKAKRTLLSGIPLNDNIYVKNISFVYDSAFDEIPKIVFDISYINEDFIDGDPENGEDIPSHSPHQCSKDLIDKRDRKNLPANSAIKKNINEIINYLNTWQKEQIHEPQQN